MAPPACNRGTTGSYRDITVNNLGNTGVYRHEPWLHRKCSVVNRDSTGVCFLRDRGYTGVAPARLERNLFFMKCVPVHHGIPAVLHRDVPGGYTGTVRMGLNAGLQVKGVSDQSLDLKYAFTEI